jgi:2-succinyl-5-enolpyruvyl-6-hydroxy-3-cyclohexene-1-carboxylate synthase
MSYPKKELAQLIIKYCEAYDITDIVLSPGSRNAPLIIGFSNHSKFKTYSIVDERCAAFFALGIAQQKRKPVVVVCTSGSALLNYYPAVAEAFYSNIPLIVISADRPKHLIDVGDGQTIRQENVFANHIEFNANLDDDCISIENNAALINEALTNSILKKGPVHINVPFDEPLYETIDKATIQKKIELKEPKQNLLEVSITELEPFVEIWNDSSKKMILIGEYFPSEIVQKQLDKLVKDESVLILTETTSNVHHPKFINSIDNLIFPFDEIQKKEFQPDVLLTFGGMVISKRIKKIIRESKPTHHWHISTKHAPDTFQCLTHHFKQIPELFFEQFSVMIHPVKSVYQQKWLDVKSYRENAHTSYLKKCIFSDLMVFDILIKSLPNNILLQSGNSSVIRYLQLFDVKKEVQTFCNRGTSGIDGSTSTAIGASLATNMQTIFMTGDISFFYDSNALWNNYIKSDFRIILINNSGGGIFRIIPGPKSSNSAEYFETTHNLTAKNLCDMHGFEYASAEGEIELKQSLKEFYNTSNKPRLLEIFTPKDENDSVLKKYFNYLK